MTLETGCYVDGHWGQYGAARVIIVAHELGYDDATAVALATKKLDAMMPSRHVELTLDEEDMLIDCCDDAERYLNENVAAQGYSFGWNDGEFFYWATEQWTEDN